MVAFELPAREYAVGTVSGGRTAVLKVYDELPDWAERNGRKIDQTQLWLEVYSKRPVLDWDGQFDYEIWLPLVPKD